MKLTFCCCVLTFFLKKAPGNRVTHTYHAGDDDDATFSLRVCQECFLLVKKGSDPSPKKFPNEPKSGATSKRGRLLSTETGSKLPAPRRVTKELPTTDVRLGFCPHTKHSPEQSSTALVVVVKWHLELFGIRVPTLAFS